MGSGKQEPADAAEHAESSAARPDSPPASAMESQPTEKLSRGDVPLESRPTEQISRREENSAEEGDFGPPLSDFGPSQSEFGPAQSGFGPSQSEFGPSQSEFGPPQSEFGPPQSEFGPPLSEFGPPLAEFGPPVADFGQPVDSGASGWTPAPAAPSPEIGWRPADAGPTTPAPPPQYRAPDSSTAPPTVRYPAEDNPDATVRLSGEQGPSKPSGWAAAGGIKTSESGRESAWLRSADSAMPAPAQRTTGAKSAGATQESLSWADDPIAKALAPKPGAAKSAGSQSLWADDDLAKRLAPKSAPPPHESSRPWGRIAAGAGAAIAALLAIVVTVVVLTRGGADEESANPLVTTSVAPSGGAALSCPARKDGNTLVGNGPGSTDTGAGAILGFQHGFYAERSGAQARSYVAPDAPNVSPADTIQAAINQVIPVGTTYCLRIVELTPDSFDADLTEHRPDGSTTVYHQRITTVNREGKHLIFEIAER